MTVVSVSMPESLLERIDEEHGYTGRSEIIREASRNLLGEFEEKMMHLRHEYEGLVASNFHSNVPTSARTVSGKPLEQRQEGGTRLHSEDDEYRRSTAGKPRDNARQPRRQ